MPEEQSRVQRKKILVADDNKIILKAVGMVLESSGYEVITATDGAAVVSIVDREIPHLILLDLLFALGWLFHYALASQYERGQGHSDYYYFGRGTGKIRGSQLGGGGAGVFAEAAGHGRIGRHHPQGAQRKSTCHRGVKAPVQGFVDSFPHEGRYNPAVPAAGVSWSSVCPDHGASSRR